IVIFMCRGTCIIAARYAPFSIKYFLHAGFTAVIMSEKKRINFIFNDLFQIITVFQLSSQLKIKRMMMQVDDL
ncbi:MAG TPA: hypothetical protein VMW32_11295, partial [Bacteroidales bacterium]|nr:hypothetical protein [Bacteroidales bacterium]